VPWDYQDIKQYGIKEKGSIVLAQNRFHCDHQVGYLGVLESTNIKLNAHITVLSHAGIDALKEKQGVLSLLAEPKVACRFRQLMVSLVAKEKGLEVGHRSGDLRAEW